MDSPWKPAEEQTAAWLQQHGFRPKTLVEPDWSEPEKQEFELAVLELAQGKRMKPSEQMSTAHYLSHHVMHLRHSEQSCKRMLRRICRQAGRAVVMSADSDSEHGSDEDSSDELELPAPLGMEPQ